MFIVFPAFFYATLIAIFNKLMDILQMIMEFLFIALENNLVKYYFP